MLRFAHTSAMDGSVAPSANLAQQASMEQLASQSKTFQTAIELAQNVEAPTADMVPRDLGGPQESCIAHKVKALEGPAQFAHQSSLKQQSA